MNRVIFLVDGFNLYHSCKDISRFSGLRVKWLDIRSLCWSYLPLISRDAKLERIYYFTAFAFHLNDPGVIQRHQDYIKCLQETGIIPKLGRFKPKDMDCPHCNRRIIRHEEKETDVAIAMKLSEILFKNICDTAVLMTGDTDLTPAIKHTKRLFPDKTIIFAFPYRRANAELAQIAPGSFKIHKGSYVRHQFPGIVVLRNGTYTEKPDSW
jgi:uncharacterized LabA/DUF88 family protein